MMRAGLLMLVLFTGCAQTRVAAVKGAGTRFDVRILNARVVDGTGAPWFRADVGLRGTQIAAIGDLSEAAAALTIDAKDRVLAPGFIDLLGQSEWSVFKDPLLEGKVRQGVTTEISGEGRTRAPLNEAMVEEDRRESPEDKPVSWRTVGDFLHALELNRSAINFGLFIGSANARQIAMGEVARDPTNEELHVMEDVVDRAMQDGAFGMSTSLIYVPAVYSKTEELIRLAKISARYGGLYFTHLRNEGDRILEALDEAFRIGREARCPVNIWHLKVSGKNNWGRMSQVVSRILDARKSGLDVAANVYPYVASGTGLTALVPAWALEGGYEAFLARLKDPVGRRKIAAEIGATDTASGFFSRVGGGDGVLVTSIPNPAFAQYERRRVTEIASMMKVDPVEAILRLLQSSTHTPDAIYFSMNEADLRHALSQPFVSVGADSGAVTLEGRKKGAHPRAYGTFPRVVGRYAREGLFSLEEAVRKVTSQAAARVRLYERGLIRPG
ncbi:MAG: N-acyl-D-amino-acid deacylase family protein, partial [Myxococcaceae bacterium]